MPKLFEQTSRVNSELLYKRNDANDVRLGETVHTELEQYEAADIVLLGCPQDEGVRRNKGRVGAKDAPDAIRRCLYRYVTIEDLNFFDLGNTIIQDTLEATHDAHREVVRQVLRDGKRLVVLGGGNDVSYPDCSALAMETTGDILAFNMDAHFDVRDDKPRNSGTPYRQLLEEKHIKPQDFYILGYQLHANSSAYLQYFRNKGTNLTNLFSIHEVVSLGIVPLIQDLLRPNVPTFFGLDMDVVCAADAPGVSAVNPTGFGAWEVVQVAIALGENPLIRLFEITEVNPTYDIDDRTSRLAAAAIWHFLSASIYKGEA